MIRSIKNLFRSPYNRAHPVAAIFRFSFWKVMRLLKMKEVKYKVWKNRKLVLNYDSFHSMWLMYNYIVDWEEFNLIKHFLQPADHVADVGSNMGYYTIWMSKFITTGTIHSFEPDEENFKRLEKNCELNNLKNVRLNKLALSDRSGQLSFTRLLDGENHLSLEDSAGTVHVESLTFEDYSRKEGVEKYSYVKVDIEGFELFFLKGATSLLRDKKIDIIQLEINSQVKNSNTNISDLLDLIKNAGYSLCKYDVDRREVVEVDYGNERENYFAVRDTGFVNSRLNSER